MYARKFLRSGLFLAMVFCEMSANGLRAAEPATVESAAAVWNGLTWPVPKDVKEPQRQMAALMYEADGDAQSAYDFQKKALVDAKWKEEPGAYLSKESSSGTYRKNGYALSLMAYGVKPGRVNVSFTTHGNVEVNKLPVPMGAKLLFAGPVSTMYVIDTPPDKTAEAIKSLLAKQGWQPYGAVGDTRWFRQNAVRLTAFIGAAPAQGNKTSLTYSTELMSAELPAPPVTINLQYADSTKTVSFDSAESFADVLKFYQATLKKAGWEATTENLIKIDFRQTMIFRNKAKDMLTLELHEFEGKTRCLLKHETSVEVREKYERQKKAAMAAGVDAADAVPKITLRFPAGAKGARIAGREAGFSVASGKAKAAAIEMAATLNKDGWTSVAEEFDPMVGTLRLSKGEQCFEILYIGDDVILTVFGVRFKTAADK